MPRLFSKEEIPELTVQAEKNFASLKYPVWTESKAKLIQEYIRLFTFITKHGTYIDGFAAPQRRDRLDLCSANLVLQTEPKWLRDFWLCDIDPAGCAILDNIAEPHRDQGRSVSVLEGDFNRRVDDVLLSGQITERTATFALLDQRTFECEWASVQKIASHKVSMKIEIFYFLATGWLDRSIAAVRRHDTKARLDRWWGAPNWTALRGMNSIDRAYLLADRFRTEFGYKFVHPYAIHGRARGGRTMYHMIHATDHAEASPLMLRAYRKISGALSNREMRQDDFESLW
ncbi:three-Cys-motif partner protein TcmP [Parasphingopyxis algicola]|nr:three-Cys-motif partner protein TcmP [Parasphingopyxis algicola]